MGNDEQTKLEMISLNSLYSEGVMVPAIQYCFKVAQRYLSGDHILELGPAEGVMTEQLVNTRKRLTVVEGSLAFCENLRKRFPDVEVVNALFEEFEPSKKFDFIILGHVLEHVQDPVGILRRVRGWLQPEGKLFAAVPNSRSIHRQAAVAMGLLSQEDELNSKDRHHGHRVVFNPETFRAIFIQAGLNVDVFGGYWLKPVSNGQLEQSWSQEMIEAFMCLGERYPDIAGEIYVVASNIEKRALNIDASAI